MVRTPPSGRRLSPAVAPLTAAVLLVFGTTLESQSLGGSAASLDRQNAQAQSHGFTYLSTPGQVLNFVDGGYLVRVVPNQDLELHQVSFPYVRPEIRVFVERLASQYRSACGEKLVVTSLTRPLSAQPRNASDRSVHPTGMAVDLRRSNRTACRTWLESTLVSLEGTGVLEATRERRPPHYHLAVYPALYASYVIRLTGSPEVLAQEASEPGEMEPPAPTPAASDQRSFRHTVSRGESLWIIARRYEVDEASLRRSNGLTGDRIFPGQSLTVPAGSEGPSTAFRHTVSRGESLWTIARAYRVSEDAIRAVNGIPGSRILVGEVLTIPGERGGEGILQHTVRRGESLWTIANRHGTTVEELRRTNGIQTSRIFAGQILNVPLRF